MEIVFTKGAGKVDLMDVMHPGNSPQRVAPPGGFRLRRVAGYLDS